MKTRLGICGLAFGAFALGGCQSVPVGSEAPTPENIAARILVLCAYSVPVLEIAAELKANPAGLQTASDIGKIICQTASQVVANGTPNPPAAATPRGFVALPTVPQPVAVPVGGVVLHLKPIA